MMGNMCFSGEHVQQSSAKAAELYERAARQGHADAQFHLGAMYAHGHGVKKSHEKAVEWYERAAAQGTALAKFTLGVMQREYIPK